jgi:transcriptional repressor NrdR
LEPFNPDKIRRGIELAVEKRPVTPEQVTQLVEDITATVKARDERVVPSHVIGDLVVERLRELDQVAYVRFVSVYKSFSNPEDFNAVLDSLLDEQSQPGTGDTT